jgi:hypothetical protein
VGSGGKIKVFWVFSSEKNRLAQAGPGLPPFRKIAYDILANKVAAEAAAFETGYVHVTV